jgi:glycine betaine/proline transport system substrate-binding protein
MSKITNFNFNHEWSENSMRKLIILVMILVINPAYAGENITLAEFSWESINIHNQILKNVIEAVHEIPVEILMVESAPGQVGIVNGDINIVTEIWLSNRLTWFDEENNKTIVSVGSVFSTPVTQGWFVPYYINDKIKTIYDVINNKELFSGKNTGLINAPSGWRSHEITLKRVESYELTGINVVDPGSGAGLDLAILDNYDKQLPFITYYWSPTYLMGIVNLVLLQEDPHNPELWQGNSTFKCSYPPDIVDKLINKKFYDDPKNKPIVDLVKKYQISAEDTNLLLAKRREQEMSWELFIKQFMIDNPEKWEYLVDNTDDFNKVMNYLKK